MWPRDEDQQRELMYNEQLKTNALLERIVDLMAPKKTPDLNDEQDRQEEIEFPDETKTTVNEPENTNQSNKQQRGEVK